VTDSPSPERLAAELDHKLAHLPEARMRAAVLRERLASLAAPLLYGLLAHVLRRALPGAQLADALREELHGWLSGYGEGPALDYAIRAELYACADSARDDRVMGLLRSHDASGDDGEPSTHAHLDLRDVPLGRRRSLARGRDPLLLEKLARDPDPVVIANLLANPRTSESDVVRIAALRPVAATSLEAIARAPRWCRQARVRAALAQNPHCPVDLALQQLCGLPRPELRAIADDPGLDPLLRAHAGHELARRSGAAE
jgi:hypothetical protein